MRDGPRLAALGDAALEAARALVATVPPSPVCVLGMHRCGTSLTASVIERLGVSLGPAASLIPPDGPENPNGYFEQREIIALNDEILAARSGSVWLPPVLEPGWELDPALDDLYERAAELRGRLFPEARPWGFKDPRLSFTLPFWRRLVGDPLCVVCIRPASAVAASLSLRFSRRRRRFRPGDPMRRARGGERDWAFLVERYTASAMIVTTQTPRIVVDFDEWFVNPEGPIRRIADFLGATTTPAMEAAAGELVDPALRHHLPPGEG